MTKQNIFRLERVSNMIFLTDAADQVWRVWDESEFTERKLKNAERELDKAFCGNYIINRIC